MADITANLQNLYEEGLGPKIVLYRVRDVDTTDTISVSAEFVSTMEAVAIASENADAVAVTGFPATTLTLTLAGVAADTVYLLVYGQAAV